MMCVFGFINQWTIVGVIKTNLTFWAVGTHKKYCVSVPNPSIFFNKRVKKKASFFYKSKKTFRITKETNIQNTLIFSKIDIN
ncbi:hypothetical protein FUAX_16760 [Fulvitalea axinellae]|uniref:Uncharacterized protein n=1 Tax=Fulvitalea axinellae TaxID=1182444 RepID=A0AAU9D454_9BACT|nr:hypothetical protein FUAX_16760 [Fulvitalea axinellae]